MSVASLGMYDPPALRAANDAWWAILAKALTRQGIAEVPDALFRGEHHSSAWTRPDLLLTQTCGYPLMHEYRDWLTSVAAPRYRVDGISKAEYHSVFIVPSDSSATSLEDLRGKRATFNDDQSQSGYNALRHAIAPLAREGRFFGEAFQSGGHAISAEKVANGEADIAAIDAVTFALLQKTVPEVTGRVRILGRSKTVPSLPYAVAKGTSPERIAQVRAALHEAVADPDSAAIREEILLDGFEDIDDKAYTPLVEMREEAESLGYPMLG